VGDVELDDGHSFCYQVSVFFLTYLQKQIIKGTFQSYDFTVADPAEATEGEDTETNEIQKRSLRSLLLIDFELVDAFTQGQNHKNLLMLKKGKTANEQLGELKKNFEEQAVFRVVKAGWLDKVCLKPTLDSAAKRQQAIFSLDFSPDLLLKSALNFLDLNDLA